MRFRVSVGNFLVSSLSIRRRQILILNIQGCLILFAREIWQSVEWHIILPTYNCVWQVFVLIFFFFFLMFHPEILTYRHWDIYHLPPSKCESKRIIFWMYEHADIIVTEKKLEFLLAYMGKNIRWVSAVNEETCRCNAESMSRHRAYQRVLGSLCTCYGSLSLLLFSVYMLKCTFCLLTSSVHTYILYNFVQYLHVLHIFYFVGFRYECICMYLSRVVLPEICASWTEIYLNCFDSQVNFCSIFTGVYKHIYI